MKKLNLVLSLIFLLFMAVGCSKKNEPSKKPTDDTPIEESISVVDKAGKEIKSESIYVSQTNEYTHENVFVWCIYSDDTHKDVTKNATFSSVDLSKIGEVKVTVTYKEFTTNYTVNVKENKVQEISVDNMNCKVLYPLGSIFDSAGLSVHGTLEDGSLVAITDYTLSLKNSTKSIKEPLDSKGKQQVVVSYGNLSKEFDILVYEENYSASYEYAIDYLAGDVVVDENGDYEFKTPSTAMDNAIAKMTIDSTTLKTKEANGADVNYTYMSETYHSYLFIPTEDGIEITLKSQTDLLLVVSDLYGAKISFKKESEVIDTFGGKPNNYTSLLYCSLEAGTYQLISSNKGSRLYGITFQSSSATASDFELDAQNMKKIYNVGDSLDLSGLKAYYVWEDGTKSEASVNKINYRILDSKNSTVNNLNTIGTYTVVFTMGKMTRSVPIEVTDSRSFTGIELDTRNVKTEFNGTSFEYDNLKVYGIAATGRELLSYGTDYTVELSYNNQKVQNFTTPGTYTVTVTYLGKGCQNNKSFYTVKYTAEASNLVLEASNVKKKYSINEPLDLSNLVVMIKYKDQNTENVALSSITRVIKYNGQEVIDLSEVGEYSISIQYNGLEASFTITVHAPQQYTSIELDTTNVNKNFMGSAFEYNKLKAYGITQGSAKEELPLSELKITLFLSEEEVNSFTISGTYTVKVSYVGAVVCANPTASYTVEYTVAKITFGYSGPNVPQESWEEDLTTPLDYASYIRIPSSNHVFLGFSDFYPTGFIKVYVDTAKTGNACWYVYVSPRYERISSSATPNEPASEDFRYVLRDGEIFDHFELDTQRSTNNYKLYVAVCMVETSSVNVTIHSTTEAHLSLTNPFTGSVTVDGVLTDTDGNEIEFSSLNPSFDNLNPNTLYKISGVIKEGTKSALIEEKTFSTNVASYLTSITEDQALSHVSEQSIEIDCTPYRNTVPDGYRLVGFELINEKEEVVSQMAYTSSMDTVYFTNLEANTKYAVRSCYSRVSSSSRRMAMKESKFTYDFNFVGFWVISYGKELHRIRMQYQGDTLYTWYVGDYNYFDQSTFLNFALPNELKNYVVVGCKTPLYNIMEDKDVEVELKLRETGQTIVAFYGFQGVLIDSYETTNTENITYPTPPSTISYGTYEYEFNEWYQDYSVYPNVLGYRAGYSCITETDSSDLVYPYSFYVYSDKIYVDSAVYTGSTYYVDYYQRIYTAAGNDITDSLVFEPSSSYWDKEGEYKGLTPNTEYVFKGYLIYNLLDGNGNQTKEYSYTFQTLAIDATKNITLSYKQYPHEPYALQLSSNKNNFDLYVLTHKKNIFTISNDEYIQWNYFDLGQLEDESPLNIYYADIQTLGDSSSMIYVYTTKPLVYQLEEVKEVQIEEVLVYMPVNLEDTYQVLIHVKGKNVRYANLYIEVTAYYPEFQGPLPQIREAAYYKEIVSDNEVIYYWEPYWEVGAEHPYDGVFEQLACIFYQSLGQHYSGILEMKDTEDESVFQAYSFELFS